MDTLDGLVILVLVDIAGIAVNQGLVVGQASLDSQVTQDGPVRQVRLVFLVQVVLRDHQVIRVGPVGVVNPGIVDNRVGLVGLDSVGFPVIQVLVS